MDSRIARLREQNIYVGTSSWKYPGWKGWFYKRPYRTEKEFNETCLEEYGSLMTAVGVDHTYYAWPTEKGFAKYAAQTPGNFRFGMKATEKVTVFQYPNLKRYGKDAGTRNAGFLDAGLFKENFLKPLRPVRDRLGPIMLEFSQFHPGSIANGSEFVARLDQFFATLRDEEGFRFAVEMRNANWLKAPYFEMLLKHGAGHVFNSWTRMPTLTEQLRLSEPYDLPFYASRILLQPGTKYAEAVEAFSPYDRVHELQPTLRQAAVGLVRRALERRVPGYLFVNNRAEGSAPQTIRGILDILEPLPQQ